MKKYFWELQATFLEARSTRRRSHRRQDVTSAPVALATRCKCRRIWHVAG